MSLWTPGGEHEVPREPAAEPSSSGSAPGAADTEVPPGLLPEGVSLDDLSPEERARVEEMIAQMGEAQRQLVEAPIEVVIGNHAIGFYELAALHRVLAIDGMHLAAADRLPRPLTFVTLDAAQIPAALALGFEVQPG